MFEPKLVILAGGLGSRLSEETISKPKPMVTIGGIPIILHIMKYYSCFNVTNFIICGGYKYQSFRRLVKNFKNKTIYSNFVKKSEFNKWNINLVDTGLNTMTGGRIKRIKNYVKDDPYFLLTYGDGLSNINIKKTINLFKKSKKLALVSAVNQPPRYGALKINKNNMVVNFLEKHKDHKNKINGGFFVLSPKVINYIAGDHTIWEQRPLQNLAKFKNLIAYNHNDFWHPMDTLRDKNHLENLWSNKKSKWKIW